MIDKIKQLLLEENNKSILEYIKKAERQHSSTNLSSMKASFSVKNIEPPTTDQLRAFFKQLEVLNLGDLIREASTYKFKWKEPYSFVYLNKVMEGTQNAIAEEVKDCQETKVEEPITKDEEVSILTHEFFLRPSLKIKINLPEDFSMSESDRVQSFIKSLPFNN